MKIIAILLIISSLTKFYMASANDRLEMKELTYNIPLDFETISQILKAILTFDGLIGLLSGIFILCL